MSKGRGGKVEARGRSESSFDDLDPLAGIVKGMSEGGGVEGG